MALIENKGGRPGTPVEMVDKAHFDACRRRLDTVSRRYLDGCSFEPTPGRMVLLPDAKGAVARVIVGVDADDPVWALGSLPTQLPLGRYYLADEGLQLDPTLTALGWALGAYRFATYKPAGREPAHLVVDKAVLAELTPLVDAASQVRDLVNTPAEELGPEQISDAIKALGRTHRAKVREWVGDDLLEANFPTIHAVGRASHRAPRLVELSWGKASAPRLTLVGKGVTFDSGGLNLKGGSGMRWMKKDMGGAAHAIGLARLVMQAKLPVRLTLLIPTVENSVSGSSLRPGDVVRTRAGHAVEIDNTDAEGRLILCDALAYASESEPELLIDFATLTGAARVALGPDLPALFANRDELADTLLGACQDTRDPLWRMPLWKPYNHMLDSYLADFANSGSSRHAGAITAALYLKHFVPDAIDWMHVDVYAWNDADRPGRPRGGEAQGLRAMFRFLQERYPS